MAIQAILKLSSGEFVTGNLCSSDIVSTEFSYYSLFELKILVASCFVQ